MSEKNLLQLVSIDVESYCKELMLLENPEERIDSMLKYMQVQLSHGEIHPLSRFWRMRKFCLDHFKETLNASKRLYLWDKYRTLIDEIVKLKQIIDEKSSFEKMQIENAVQSLIKEISSIEKLIAKEPELSVPKCHFIQRDQEFYKSRQKALNVYSSYAKRLNSLKKEILNLDISYKKKQETLDQIHELSDQIFPKKRELLNEVSKNYLSSVEEFVRVNFKNEPSKLPAFALKEQIKQLQNFAKTISLNVEAFSKTRLSLSQCWDQLKAFESEQKKIKDEKKQISLSRFEEFKKKISDLKQLKDTKDPKEFQNEFKQLMEQMESQDLLKYHRKQLTDELLAFEPAKKQPAQDGVEEKNFSALKKTIHQIKEQIKLLDSEGLNEQIDELMQQISDFKLLESSYTKLRREVFTLKESLSKKIVDEMQRGEISEQLLARAESVKKNLRKDLETYRKALGSSNQSIEKAIIYNELVMQSKELIKLLDSEKNHLAGKS